MTRYARDTAVAVLIVCVLVILAAVLFACAEETTPPGSGRADGWTTVHDPETGFDFRCFTIWRASSTNHAGGPAMFCYQVGG